MSILATTAHKGGMTAVSPAMGGCGQPHKYEIGPTGYPQVTCPKCEEHLRSDPHHATVPSKVPMTYDEKLIKEDLESRSNARQQLIQAIASAEIAGMHEEAEMLAAMGGIKLPAAGIKLPARAHVPQTVDCPNGHAVPVGQKFCGQCGEMAGVAFKVLSAEPPALAAQSAPEPPAEPAPAPKDPEPPAHASAPPSTALPSNTKLRGMKAGELKGHAVSAGLSTEGTREQLLNRLIAHNNAGKAG